MTFDNSEQFAGRRVVDYERGTPLTDLETVAWRIGVDYEEEHTAVDLLTDLLQDPNVDRLQALVIGAWVGVDSLNDSSSAEIVEALVAAAPQFGSLTALFLGDISSEESEVSWIQQSDVSPLWAAFPRLEHFVVRGSEGLQLGPLKHDLLKSLTVECGGLPRSVLHEVAAARLPSLEHLELYLGTDNYGWDGSLDDVRPLLEPGRFPKLKTLGLRDSQIADEVARAVAESSILTQIKVLDLSLGTMGDEGGLALLGCKDLGRLEKLDLHHNYLSDKVAAQFQKLSIAVDVSDQQSEDEYGRYVAIGE